MPERGAVGYGYRRRRSGPRWGLILSLVLVGGAAIYFAPRYLTPSLPGAPEPSPAVSPAPLVAPSPSLAPQQTLAEGDELLGRGRWADAAAAYASAGGGSSAAIAGARRAMALVFADKLPDAVAQAQKAADLDPRLAEAQVALALAHNWSGNADRAITAARRAAELDPKLPRAHAYLAEGFIDKYKLQDAEDALNRAVAAGGADDPEVLRVQGYLQETRADYAAAVERYRRAVTLAPENSYLHRALGLALLAEKNTEGAIQEFQRAVTLNPADARAEGGMGMVYYSLEEYGSAQSHLERATELDPSYANAQGQLGWVFYVQKVYDRAQPYFERAIALEKNPARNSTYRLALGWIHVNQKRYEDARKEFTKALELNPDLQGARDGLQVVDQQTGRAS